MTAVALDHVGPWTESEYLSLPESHDRIELLDGSLLVSPAPTSDHQQYARRLANLLEAAAPDSFEVVEAVNVRVAPGRILIPDVVVTPRRGVTTVYRPGEVLLVVEVVSPSTATIDRVTKLGLYAAAEIPHCLLAEVAGPSAPAMELYELAGVTYRLSARAGAGGSVSLAEPIVVELDPAAPLDRG